MQETVAMPDHELNNPDVRHHLLLARLLSGEQLVAAALADELNVSPDTIRRDLMALENSGVAKRVRGGAVPLEPLGRLQADWSGPAKLRMPC